MDKDNYQEIHLFKKSELRKLLPESNISLLQVFGIPISLVAWKKLISMLKIEGLMVIGWLKTASSRYPIGQVSLLLTLASLILWAYSLTQAEFEIGFFGLINSFPVIFFLSLVVLAAASFILWVSPEKHGKLLCFQTCLFILQLWLSAWVISGLHSNPFQVANHPYAHYNNTHYILINGHLRPDMGAYHAWPATWLDSTALIEVLGIKDPDFLIAITPIVMQFLFLPLVYLFLRNTLGKGNRCWAGVWLFYLGNWVTATYLGAQTMGVFLFLFLLALMSVVMAKNTITMTFERSFVTIITLASLTITHGLGALAGLIVCLALYFTRHLRSWNLTALFAVFIGSWMLYMAFGYFAANLDVFIRMAFRVGDTVQLSVVQPFQQTSAAHQAVIRVRLITIGVLSLIALAGFFFGRKKNFNTDIAIIAMSVGFIALTASMAGIYWSEVPQRAFTFLALPVGYFGVKLLDRKATALFFGILLLLLLPLYFISAYGNVPTDRISPGDIAGQHFFGAKTIPGNLTGGPVLAYRTVDQGVYTYIPIEKFRFEGATVDTGTPVRRPHYISVGDWDRAIADFNHNDPRFFDEIQQRLDTAVNSNLIYANSYLDLYVVE